MMFMEKKDLAHVDKKAARFINYLILAAFIADVRSVQETVLNQNRT